jgi:polysaccharide pyruvyl transferase WcaK-like protein
MRIGILAHVGNGNLGDEATVAALVRNARARQPGSEIVVFSMDPEDTERRHAVRAVPIRPDAGRRSRSRQASDHASIPPGKLSQSPKGLRARLRDGLRKVPLVYRFLHQMARLGRRVRAAGPEAVFVVRSFVVLTHLDRLIIAGGGQLGDYFGGPWGYPLTIFKWCALARLARVQVSFVSVGAEPVYSPISKRFFRWALALADYRSFRDEGSRRLMESVGAPPGGAVYPDLVHGLHPKIITPRQPSVGPGLTVGLNPVPFFDSRYWTEHDETIYERYVANLAAFASWLLGRNHRVLFFPTQIHADPWVIHDIQMVMKRSGSEGREDRILTPSVTSLDDLWTALSLTDVIVASRFHGLIFSSLLERPVLALSYYSKMEELMERMGQRDYVLPITTLDVDSLIRCFLALEHDLKPARVRLIDRRSAHLAALESQYDAVFR